MNFSYTKVKVLAGMPKDVEIEGNKYVFTYKYRGIFFPDLSECESMVKERLCVTIEKELIEWIDKQANTIRFRNRSHVVEYAVAKLKEEMEGESP